MKVKLSSPASAKFKHNIISTFNKIKKERKVGIPVLIPIYRENIMIGFMRPVTQSSQEDVDDIKRLARWRKDNGNFFPSQFKVTVNGTKIWILQNLINQKDRLLFIIETPTGIPIGHIGLFRFDYRNFSCEIDNVIRGESLVPGIMKEALLALIYWTKNYLNVKKLGLQVFSDNERAIKLYKKIGFKEIKKIPLKKVKGKERTDWIEDINFKNPARYNSYMSLSK